MATSWKWAPVLGLAGYLAVVAAQAALQDGSEQGAGDWAIASSIASVVTAVAVARWAVARGLRAPNATAAAFGAPGRAFGRSHKEQEQRERGRLMKSTW